MTNYPAINQAVLVQGSRREDALYSGLAQQRAGRSYRAPVPTVPETVLNHPIVVACCWTADKCCARVEADNKLVNIVP